MSEVKRNSFNFLQSEVSQRIKSSITFYPIAYYAFCLS